MNDLSLTTNILKTMETSSSIGMFARDTGGCLIARLGLSRTKEESKEIAFAEVSESALFYFSAPAVAKGTSKIFSKIYNIKNELLSTPIENIKNNTTSEELKKIKLGKFGQFMTTFGIILPFVFGIAPIRNLITLSDSGKEKFTELVGLENEEKDRNKSDKQAKNLIKNLALTSAIVLASSAGVLALSKNKNVYKKVEPVIDKTLKYFEFEKSGDLKTAHYGALIYPVSIAGYFAASRDKYEKKENARRFSITVPLLFFGEKLIQNPIYKKTDKLFKTNVYNNGNIKSYKEILKLPKQEQSKFLKSKNLAYGTTFFINTLLIASAVALLNRIKTKKTFEKEHKTGISYLNNYVSFEEFEKSIRNKKVKNEKI